MDGWIDGWIDEWMYGWEVRLHSGVGVRTTGDRSSLVISQTYKRFGGWRLSADVLNIFNII